MMLVAVKYCVKGRAMAEGRWHYRDNREFAHKHIFAQAVESHQYIHVYGID